MSAGPDPMRRFLDRPGAVRAGVAAGIVLVFVALIGSSLLTTRPPTPSASPGATLGASETSPPASSEPWEDLDVPPYEALADLVPSDVDRLGVAATTTFTLASRTSTPATELAKGLVVRPAIAFNVEPGDDPAHAVIRPAAALDRGMRYRWELTAPDGALAGSWLFTARQPLHVASSLPADQATGVPLNTGIEVTFDQDGTIDVPDHLTIEPAVRGRFEQHGRTWAFVADQPLAPVTIYTLTVRAGIGASGSSERLEADVVIRFETAALSGAQPARLEFERPLLEVRPNVEPVTPVRFGDEDDEGVAAPSEHPTVEVHRLPTLHSAVDAATRLSGELGWAVAAPDAIVPTTGLERVASVAAELIDWDYGPLLHVPVRLPAGRYLLSIDQSGGPAQLLLQVTDVGAYALVTTGSTVFWVGDLGDGTGLGGATIELVGSGELGTTGANGVLTTSTPPALRSRTAEEGPSEAASVVVVRASGGRALVAVIGLPWSWAFDSGLQGDGGTTSPYWNLFRSDRFVYRQTDTVHLSGLLVRRSDRTVPSGVEVRLLPAEAVHGETDQAVPLLTVPISLSARGSFVADLPLVDLSRSQYRLELAVDGKAAGWLWITVADIRKPAFEIVLDTDRAAYFAGEPVTVSATATFYDGTAVPGLALQLSGFGDTANLTTGPTGEATASLEAGFSDEGAPWGWAGESITAQPLRPEEGDIFGGDEVIVFPARVWLSGSARQATDRIVVDGRLIRPDIEAFAASRERDLEASEPSGDAIVGGKVTVKVIHHVTTRTQVGTTYDFIEKKVVPVYEESSRELTLGTYDVTSGADGTFRVSAGVPKPDDWYEVIVSAVDANGRQLQRSFDVIRPLGAVRDQAPYLLPNRGCGSGPSMTVGLGDAATVTMHDADGTIATGGRFLYVVTRQGEVQAIVQDDATFRRTMRDADLPSLTIFGVWLTNDGFAAASALARVDEADKRISVRLRTDASTYAPGDPVTIGVSTVGPDGRPIAADVIVQGIDQKLYAIGAAYDVDPLGPLLAPVSSGFVQSYSSHALPHVTEGGCGDAGGDREDFADVVTFQRITTDANGRGSATFRLSDDLTSWHVTATALTRGLNAGQASVLVPVGLPFFAEAVLAPEYLVGEQPVLRLRGYGDGIVAGDRVRFHVTSDSLDLDETVTATAFEAIRVPLPALSLGQHDIRIEAVATHSGASLKDALVRTVRVIQSRLTGLEQRYDLLAPGYAPAGGGGLTTYVVTDAGRGSLMALLQDLAGSASARYDRAAAADGARQLLIETFGMGPGTLPPASFQADRYGSGYGITLLPYSSPDVALTSLAALTVPSRLNAEATLEWLLEPDDDREATREARLIAIAGAAGLGADVVAELRTIQPSDLTIREQLWLALGLAAAGDHPGARAIERDLLERHGQRLGPWVRLAAGSTLEDTLEGSALLLVLAARLGDPLGAEVARYLLDNPSKERAVALELFAYAENALAWLPRAAGRFAYTVDGARREVVLEPGASFSMVLTAAKRATLQLQPLDGRLAVVTSWTREAPTLPDDPSITVTRTITPADDATETGMVKVRLVVTFGAKMPAGCYQLTDVLPSGLAPVAREGRGDEEDQATTWPYEVDGQRVSWCVDPRDKNLSFGYSARVVSPGTYRWEPAVIQSLLAPELGSATDERTYTIR